MRKATRQEDIVARWGGDEFAVILPRTDEVTAASVRERILALCAEAEANPIRPSLALGSATNMDGSTDLDGLLKLAEDRMYRHKLMEGKSARNAILQSIKKMLYEKSYETEEHAGRMINIAPPFRRVIRALDRRDGRAGLLAVPARHGQDRHPRTNPAQKRQAVTGTNGRSEKKDPGKMAIISPNQHRS
jgi:hypothetical protein